MHFSVVVLSYNAQRSLGECLDKVLAALDAAGGRNEIFVVDNGSGDHSREIIEQFCTNRPDVIRAIYFENNTGTTVSRNTALRQAQGDYVLILDSDAYITATALLKLRDHLKENPDTGIAAPRLLYGNGNFQLSCDSFPTLLHKLKRFVFLKKMEQRAHPLQSVSVPTAVDYAISACWLLRANVLQTVGQFDENIFYSPEDVDYCLRVWEHGYRVTYVPDAEVIHDAQELSRGLRFSSFHWSHLAGLIYLFRKHRYFFGHSRLYRRLHRFDTSLRGTK